VATGAVCDDLRAHLRSQSVITGQIGRRPASVEAEFLGQANPLVAARTGHQRHVHRVDRRLRIQVRLDGVNTVAVRAHWRLRIAARYCLSVDALSKFLLHRPMTFGTGARNVELEDRRLGIAGGQNLVRAVTIGAHGSLLGTGCNRATVDALLI